jgi:GDP-L-fucose synthase
MIEPAARFSLNERRVYVAGHNGMAGAAIMRRLAGEGCALLTADRRAVDLRRQEETERLLERLRPDVVVLAAARVGGIKANNDFPVDFLADNLAIQTNVLTACHRVGVDRLLFLGSTCIYPRDAPQPMREESLLTGPLEPSNQWYAIAKIAGLKLAQAYRRQYARHYISVMPTNLYGPGDNYHSEHSHVVAALIRRFHEAKQAGDAAVTVWGTGTPRREFLYAGDFADACVFLLKAYDGEEPVNIGVGEDVSIAELARLVADTVAYGGRIVYDPSKLDGTPRKLVDISRLSALGWRARTPLRAGLALAYQHFLAEGANRREV